jgi:3-deoxy-manno-octulosonate cytidylyltransferase (CMP-KDO synthetase)
MAASRLPGKPLADIHGHPMISWMVAIGRAAGVGPVAVACAEREIAAAAEAAGATAVLTAPSLPSGTDRIAAALAQIDPEGRHDVIVNLQGDMPTFAPEDLARAVAALHAADIATLVSPSADPSDRENPNLVKAVCTDDGRCLYFSRACVPHGPGPLLRHVGIYVYRREALERFVAAPPTPLEQRERLEQLRALELGLDIRADSIADFPKGVDGPADLDAARQALAGRPLPR